MLRKLLFVFFCSIAGFSLLAACGGSTDTTGANANGGANNSAASNQKLPDGLSTSPVPISGTTPGIPDPSSVNMNSVSKGTTPTPGIPDPKEFNKPLKPGATPTPGIPDPKTLQKQLNPPLANQSQSDSTKQPPPPMKATPDSVNKPMTVKKP